MYTKESILGDLEESIRYTFTELLDLNPKDPMFDIAVQDILTLNLIQALPDLYEACKNIGLNLAVNYDDDNKPYFIVDNEYLDRVKLIVAKAKGK